MRRLSAAAQPAPSGRLLVRFELLRLGELAHVPAHRLLKQRPAASDPPVLDEVRVGCDVARVGALPGVVSGEREVSARVSARVSAKRRLRVRLADRSGGRRIGRLLVHPRRQHERVRLLARDERGDHGERHLGLLRRKSAIVLKSGWILNHDELVRLACVVWYGAGG